MGKIIGAIGMSHIMFPPDGIEEQAERIVRQLGGKWQGDFAMCRCPAHADGKALDALCGRSRRPAARYPRGTALRAQFARHPAQS